MLLKLFGGRKHKPKLRQVPPKSTLAPTPARAGEGSSALKIIHAGGHVERYYMAVPAARIMEKYPSFILARPDIFRRPWDAVVQPEEILVPGQKFYIVPRRTLKELQRRIRKPGGRESSTSSFVSQSSTDFSAVVVSQKREDFSSKSFIQQTDVSVSSSSIGTSKTKGKTGARNRRVRFFGIDTTEDSNSVSMEKKGNAEENPNKSLDPQPGGGKRRARNAVTWEPTLGVITETQGFDE